MVMAPYDIVGSYGRDFDPLINAEFTGNWYESYNPGSPSVKALLPTPGANLHVTIAEAGSTDEVRAAFNIRGFAYFVVGSRIIQMSPTESYITLNSISTSSGYVGIEANESQIIFVDGANGYLWNGSTLVQITDEDFPASPGAVTYLDGFFIVAQTSSNSFFVSAIGNGASWDASQFANLTTKPDKLVSVSVLKRRLFVLGQTTTEIWYNAGAPGFPFARDNNFSFEFGCAAAGSVANGEGYLIWLGQTENGVGSIMMTTGADIRPVSTPQVDLAIQSYERFDDARAYIYKINGHVFYVISFPTADVTWVYDATTDKWFNQFMVDDSRYFGQCHTFFNNKHYVGHYKAPKIYEVSREYTNNDGELIKRIRVGKTFEPQDGKRLCMNYFEVRFRQGLGLKPLPVDDFYTTPDGAVYKDPEGNPYTTSDFDPASLRRMDDDVRAYLSYSSDGGKTYGNQVYQKMGKVGQYEWRTVWNRLGMCDRFTPRLMVVEDMDVIVTGANVSYDLLRF
jgi:hypothetical protein